MQDLFDDTSYSYTPFILLTFSAGSFGGYVEMLCSVCFVKVEKLPVLYGRLERFRFSILQSKVFAALRMKRLTGVLWWHNIDTRFSEYSVRFLPGSSFDT